MWVRHANLIACRRVRYSRIMVSIWRAFVMHDYLLKTTSEDASGVRLYHSENVSSSVC